LPGFESEAYDAQTFPGIECVYVIEGSIHVSTKAKEALLGTGDIAWIDGSTKRQYRCRGDSPARAMMIRFPV